MRTKKTITLCANDNPINVICPGHVSQKEFNKAHVAEGWDHSNYKQKDLTYIYATMKKTKNTIRFTKCSPDKKGAKPYTWTTWD